MPRILQIRNTGIKRLLFFWISSFISGTAGYFLLWLITPSHRVFGTFFRMSAYHYQFPMQYILIPCFIYGIVVSLLAKTYYKENIVIQIIHILLIVLLVVLISSTFGGMLWNLHDMQAG